MSWNPRVSTWKFCMSDSKLEHSFSSAQLSVTVWCIITYWSGIIAYSTSKATLAPQRVLDIIWGHSGIVSESENIC